MGAYSRLEQYFFGVGACSRLKGLLTFSTFRAGV